MEPLCDSTMCINATVLLVVIIAFINILFVLAWSNVYQYGSALQFHGLSHDTNIGLKIRGLSCTTVHRPVLSLAISGNFTRTVTVTISTTITFAMTINPDGV